MPTVKNTFKAELIKHAHHKYELCVRGDVTEPTTGWTVNLERANPQGINPKILLLKLVEIKPTGVAGDTGAKHLIGEHAELVAEVEMDDDAVLVDIDTPEALDALRQKRKPVGGAAF